MSFILVVLRLITGLDYISAAGAEAFDELEKVGDKLGIKGVSF